MLIVLLTGAALTAATAAVQTTWYVDDDARLTGDGNLDLSDLSTLLAVYGSTCE